MKQFFTLILLALLPVLASAQDITPGYYYMKGTEASTANGYYLRTTSSDLPRMVEHEMPGTPTMNEKPYIWKVENMEGEFFSIKNIADECYLGGQVGAYAHYGTMSYAPHAIKFTFFDTYSNGSAQANNAWKLDAQTDFDTFYGSALRPGGGGEAIFLWYCDSQGGDAPVWYFEPVDATIAEQLELTEASYSGADVEEGYYLVRANANNDSKPGAYLYAEQGDIYRMYQDHTIDEIDPEGITDQTLRYIFYIKKGDGGYTFQNQQNGRYLGGSPNSNGHHVGSVTRPAPMVLQYDESRNTYTIEDKEQPRNDFLPAYLNSGSEPFAWWAGSADWLLPNIYWDLIKLDDSMMEEIVQRTIYAVGSLQGANWDTEDQTYMLEAQGKGIYTGSIDVIEGEDGLGHFILYAATMNGENIIQYSSPSKDVQLFPGIVTPFTMASGFSWAVTPGTYLITVDTNNKTIRINDPNDPDAIFSRAYAELKSAIEAAHEEWPGLDLSSVEAVLNNEASTDTELIAAKNLIPELIAAYVKEIMVSEASDNNPMNVTVLLKNADCSNTQGWTMNNALFTDYMMYAANSGFDIYQTLTDLPNGIYEIRVNAVSRYGLPNTYYQKAAPLSLDKHNAYIYATASEACQARNVADIYDFKYSQLGVDGERDYTGTGWYVPTNSASAKAYFQDGRYNQSCILAYVNDGTLTIGARRAESAYDDMFYADDWSLQYYGNSLAAFTLIASHLNETEENLEDIPAQASILAAYLDALDQVSQLDDESKMTEVYSLLAETYNALNKSQIAYAKFQNYIEEVKDILENNSGLNGAAFTLLKSYLTELVEPGSFVNGSAPYILQNGNLNEEELAAEMEKVGIMLENALKGGISPGTEITALFRNMNFDEPNFTGWEESHEGVGTCSGSHGLKSNLVAAWWDMDTAQLYQTGTDLPNGIYAISANAFYRPGDPETCSTENEIPAYVEVNGLKTPMMNILTDALSESKAEYNVNCHSTDYSTGDIRYPNAPDGASVAFTANRYFQTVYGVVTDGVLTFGVCQDAYPAYDNDWMVVDNFKVVFMGDDENAADAMVEVQCSRAEEMLASVFYYRETTREGLINALDMQASDLESKYQKAMLINQLCNEATLTGSLSAILEDVISDFQDASQNAFQNGRLSEEEFDTYFNESMDVWDMLVAGLLSDEEIIATTQKYRELTSSLIPVVSSGYYYMKGSEVSSSPGLYLSASSSELPFMVQHNMPEEPTIAEQAFIWKVETLGNGTATIQSIYDHRYLGGQIGVYPHHGTMSYAPHAIKFTFFDTYGNGSDQAKNAWKLDADLDTDSFYGTAMRPGMGGERVMLWYCDSQEGEVPAWVFEPVDESLGKAIEKTVPEYTGDDVEEGYYYVRAASTNASSAGYYLYCNGNDYFRTYQKACNEELNTTEVSEQQYPYIFLVTKQPRGYAFQNLKSQRYIGGSPNSNGHNVGAVTVPAAMKLQYDEEVQAYTILDESQQNNGFLPAYLNSGSEAWAWWAGSSESLMQSIHWNLIPITDPVLIDGITQPVNESKLAEGIYTLDGRKVGTNPRAGIYIKVGAGSVKKILIK